LASVANFLIFRLLVAELSYEQVGRAKEQGELLQREREPSYGWVLVFAARERLLSVLFFAWPTQVEQNLQKINSVLLIIITAIMLKVASWCLSS
jgi:hypothetical protein